MKTQRTPQHLSTVKEFFRDVITLVGMMTFPRRLAPVPAPIACRSSSGRERRTPRGPLTGWLPVLVGFVLLAGMPAWAGQPTLPAGVPNLYNPEVRAHFQPVVVGNLGGNRDFPLVLLVNLIGGEPQALLIGLDARNGKDTWSFTTDPIVLIVVFADQTTIQSMYVDTGLADQGKVSGSYTTVNKGDPSALPDLLKAVTAAGTQIAI